MKRSRLFWGLGWRPMVWYAVTLVLFYLSILVAGLFRAGPLDGVLLWGLPALILTWVLIRKTVRPMAEIAQGAGELAHGNLDRQIMVDGQEGLGDLARSINILAGRLRKMKKRVAEETDLSRAILNSMTEGVVALDREGRVRLINPAVERTFGVSEAACLGKGVVRAVRNYEFERLVQGVLTNGQDLVQELSLFTPQPHTFKVRVTSLPGSAGGVVAILRDITEARHLERIRSDFVANVSHELRTPLTSIKGFLETLLNGSLEDADSTRHFLEVMNNESQRLSRLIDDLFVLSDIENHRRYFKKEAVALPLLMGKIEDMFARVAQERGIIMTMNAAPDLPPAWGDRDMITQLLLNLVDNAVKYTQRDGSVEVTAHASDRGWIALRVADTGVGIREEDLPRIFERFYRVDRARSRALGGTGLGLSIVKHIVETLGGHIEITSTPGRGSVFTVGLPACGDDAAVPTDN